MSTDFPTGANNGEQPVPEQRAYVAPTPPEANPNPVMNAFRTKGYDTSAFDSDEQFVQTIESGLNQLSELPQLRHQLQQAQQASEFAPPMQTTEPQYLPEEPQEYESPWQPPEYDERWNELLSVDPDTGKYVPASEHINPDVAMKANEYRDWMRSQGKQFWQNPYDFMKPGLEGWVRDMIDEQVGAAMDQSDTDNNVDNFLQQNARRFFLTDMNGVPLQDPNTGGEMLTPEGEALKYHATAARNLGIYDANAIQEYALNMLERDLYQQQSNQHPVPQPISARLCPVISAGCSRPIRVRRVGATSLRLPSSRRWTWRWPVYTRGT